MSRVLLHSWARALDGQVHGEQVLAPGPGHSTKDRSLSVKLSSDSPDGFIVHSHAGDDPIACKDYVRGRLGLPAFRPGLKSPQAKPTRQSKQPVDDEADRQRKINAARGIWQRCRPIPGTLAEHYLRLRGLDIDEDHLRYMGFDPEAFWREVPNDPASPLLRVPCLLAAFRDIQSDEIVAVQKTRLAADSSKLGRRFNGSPKNSVIKIDPDENVTMGLVIGEGLETCLSARALGFRPVWATGTAGSVGADGVGKGGIAGFPVLDGVECLSLLLERDDNGANAKAIEACTRQWLAAGKQVFYAEPPEDCGDVNDALQKRISRA
jgi:putative DNA primase/helicase